MKYGLKVLPALVLLLCGAFQAKASFPTAPDTTRVDVAYGKQDRVETSSAFSAISGEELRKSQVSTLSNAFFGRIPGLTAMSKSGEIGYDEASVWLRGQHTSGDNGFMILVNGYEVSGFNQITAEEIESITYLKDAPALALYGMNGGNGVLLIGLITMFLGALLALFSVDLKRTLACSSMSQIGFILVGVAMQGYLDGENALAAWGTILHMLNLSLIHI